jgi:hypothetical protein
MACLKNPISQPSPDISPVWFPLIDEVTNSKKSPWHHRFPIGLYVEAFGLIFHSVNGASGRHLFWFYYSPVSFDTQVLGTWFVGYVSAKTLYYSSILCMLPTFSYCTFSSYITWTHHDVKCLYSHHYMMQVIMWLRIAVSKVPNRVGVSLLTWGPKQIQFLKCMRYEIYE